MTCVFCAIGLIHIKRPVATDVPPPPIPQHDSTTLTRAASARVTQAAKGKAREVATSTPDPPRDPPYALRGKRRRDEDAAATELPDDPISDELEVTPRKTGASSTAAVPRVQVDGGSPPAGQLDEEEYPSIIATDGVCISIAISTI